MPADQQVPRYRDAERARSTARIWAGLAVLFAVLAVLQWLAGADPWIPIGYTVAAVAYAGTAPGSPPTRAGGHRTSAARGSRDHGVSRDPGHGCARPCRETTRGPGPPDPGLCCCGRYWVRTSDLYRVKVALYH